MAFLSELPLRPIQLEGQASSDILGLALGQGANPLEIVVMQSKIRPSKNTLQDIWKKRRGGRPTPVLLVMIYENKVAVCGPTGDTAQKIFDIELSQAERLCQSVLKEPNRHAATRYLHTSIQSLESILPGVRNEGLLSTHEIQSWSNKRTHNSQHTEERLVLADTSGRQLVEALGYELISLPGPADVLASQSERRALAIFLDRDELPDATNPRFSNSSPLNYALTKASEEKLEYLIVTRGRSIRIYPIEPGVGIGRRGQAETFVELDLDLLSDKHYHLLWDIFSANALEPDSTLHQLLDNSENYAIDLGARLRERIYVDVIPQLAVSLAVNQNIENPTRQDLDFTYHMAVSLLFRILFVSYAEDKDLLPYKTNNNYRRISLKQKSHELLEIVKGEGVFDSSSYDYWDNFSELIDAVNSGSIKFGVPAYGGGLFDDNPMESRTGGSPKKIRLADNVFAPILAKVLLDENEDGLGPVDFRSLGVNEFGTIYEGLLESELSLASTDLSLDKNSQYRPAESTEVTVPKGTVYIHNRSGSRNATGSYFTKTFAVEHLLSESLEPSLDRHLAKLDALDDTDAGNLFFDFKVADISMGSGHFLVAAIDRIERRFRQYLSQRPLPVVMNELQRLRTSATASMTELESISDIEDGSLLRRQIARRCIYGVDINPIAVELARVSIWIHTFVPGLPLSTLDHHLIQGNSLLGIGGLEEVKDILDESIKGLPLFSKLIDELLDSSAQTLATMTQISEASLAETLIIRETVEQFSRNLLPLQALCDVLCAARKDPELSVDLFSIISQWQKDPHSIIGSELHQEAIKSFRGINFLHFLVVFPDVFSRPQKGFDVILGNPPWEEVKIDEWSFWARHFPGFKTLLDSERQTQIEDFALTHPDLVEAFRSDRDELEQMRKMLLTGPYPGMGNGDPDLYKGFTWRFLQLISQTNGSIGVVLPRSAWLNKGSAIFRSKLLESTTNVNLTSLTNTKGWIFDIHPQFQITLSAFQISDNDETTNRISLRGPYGSYIDYLAGMQNEAASFQIDRLLDWSSDAMIPELTNKSNESTAIILSKIKLQPKISDPRRIDFRVRPYREVDETNDKFLWNENENITNKSYWPVFQGRTFDIWKPDNGEDSYLGYVESNTALEHIQAKRLNGIGKKNSAFSDFAPEDLTNPNTHPALRPRIAFRHVSRSNDSRSFRAAIVPGKVLLGNSAPYLLFMSGGERSMAYLLGVMCSRVFDWQVRRFVNANMNFFLFDSFTVPVLNVEQEGMISSRIIEIVALLSAIDERYDEWLAKLNLGIDRKSELSETDLNAELDALVAIKYGLQADEISHIYSTFHIGWRYEKPLQLTLKYFERLESLK